MREHYKPWLVRALSLDLGKDKVMGSKNNRMKLNQ